MEVARFLSGLKEGSCIGQKLFCIVFVRGIENMN